MFPRPFQPPAPEIDQNAWAVCPWLSRTAGHVILKPGALDILQARITRTMAEFRRGLLNGLLPATQQAAEAMRRFGAAVGLSLQPFVQQAAVATPRSHATETPRRGRTWEKTGLGWVSFRRGR